MAVLVNRTASVKKNGCAFLNFPAGIWGFCYFKLESPRVILIKVYKIFEVAYNLFTMRIMCP